MRFKQYISNDYPILECLIILNNDLNEMSDETFQSIKKLGDKLGIKVSKSHSLFSLLKKFGKDVSQVIKLTIKYYFANVTGQKDKSFILKKELDNLMTSTTKKDVMSFFMQLDKNLLALTSIPRHILQSLFGLEISVYTKWLDDKNYILNSLDKIIQVLKKIDTDTKKEEQLVLILKKSIDDMSY